MTTKPTRGGSRQGSGSKPKYGEPTVKLQFRIPMSKAAEVKTSINEWLAYWSETLNK